MIDDKLTHNMQEWLDSESHDRESILHGAEMLLKLNRNMALYQTIIRRPERFESKVRYELNKFLPMRLAKMTLQDVKALDAELVPQVKAAVDEQEAHDQEGETDEGEADDDASFLLKLRLASVPTTTRCLITCAACGLTTASDGTKSSSCTIRCWALSSHATATSISASSKSFGTLTRANCSYDDYQPDADNVDEQLSPADIAKEIANARSYITKYADKLLSLRETTLKTDDAKAFEEYSALQKKVQKRVAVLADNKAPIGDELKAKLDEAGVFVPSAE